MKKSVAYIAAVAASLPFSASAELIDAGTITRDTSTGLEWLDLTESTDFSADAVASGAGNFLADGWRIARLNEVDQLFLSAGWDGLDDVSSFGSPGHLAVFNTLSGLLGLTFDGIPNFGQGWALTNTPGTVSRPFYEAEAFGPGLGRIACTSAGFAERPGDGTVDFDNCGIPSDTSFPFIGVYLVRDITDADTDGDGVPDAADNCLEVANPGQRDTDNDGIGNFCDADLTGDCQINFSDLGLLKAVFFTNDEDGDFDGDGDVSFSDLGIMKASFFTSPGPSGVISLCD